MSGNIEKDLELLKLAQKVVKEAEASAKKYPSKKVIQVVIVEPNKRPYKKIIDNDFKTMNDIVGGYTERVFISQFDGLKIALVVNEDGLLIQLPMNRKVVGFVNPLVGTFFISSYNLQGENVGLTDDLAETYIKRFTPLEVYL